MLYIPSVNYSTRNSIGSAITTITRDYASTRRRSGIYLQIFIQRVLLSANCNLSTSFLYSFPTLLVFACSQTTTSYRLPITTNEDEKTTLCRIVTVARFFCSPSNRIYYVIRVSSWLRRFCDRGHRAESYLMPVIAYFKYVSLFDSYSIDILQISKDTDPSPF